ncbi:MAG: ABC transporter ATP-binding protein [Acidobacteria bacterium]|nr:MAG: ABC transporter ATP-binding protein [Acidobacteriota bacterium]
MDLRLDNVSFSYRDGFRLGKISLDIPSGSFLGLIGPNGSGKSTLIRLMSGELSPEEGQVLLEKRPVTSFSPMELARGMAVISAEQYFDFPFLVRDVVAMGRFPHSGRSQRLASADDAVVDEVLALTDAASFADRSISHLSSGERQRVLIARALAQEPAVLLLDEPDAHLDLHHQLNVFRLLRRLNLERTITIVLVLHDLTAAAAFCRRLALLDRGMLIKHGAPAEVVRPEVIHLVYGPDITVYPNPMTGKPTVAMGGEAGPGETGQLTRDNQ